MSNKAEKTDLELAKELKEMCKDGPVINQPFEDIFKSKCEKAELEVKSGEK